jgi:hypothetical protein
MRKFGLVKRGNINNAIRLSDFEYGIYCKESVRSTQTIMDHISDTDHFIRHKSEVVKNIYHKISNIIFQRIISLRRSGTQPIRPSRGALEAFAILHGVANIGQQKSKINLFQGD